jgi:hypothetical protein
MESTLVADETERVASVNEICNIKYLEATAILPSIIWLQCVEDILDLCRISLREYRLSGPQSFSSTQDSNSPRI